MTTSLLLNMYARSRGTFVTWVNQAAQRLGLNPLEFKRFVKFAFVGAFGALVDFFTYNLFLGPFLGLFSSNTWGGSWLVAQGVTDEMLVTLGTVSAAALSFVLAILSNFTWNRYWTYPDSRSKSLRRQFAQFFVVNASGVLIRLPVVGLTHRFFTQNLLRLNLGFISAERLGSNLALALAVAMVMFWNFFANRYWTYNDV